MRIDIRGPLAALGLCGLSACAIHPLPEDVTGVSTYQIVRQIRCEARDVVKKTVIGYLKNQIHHPPSQRLGQEFEDGTRPISSFHYNMFPRGMREVIQLFYDTGIAYTYTFDATEVNNLTSDLTLIKPVATKINLGLKAGIERQRKNVRTFTVTDTFSHLLRKVPEAYCAGRVMEYGNYIYPITGRVGLDSTVHDFINLSLFGNLGAAGAPPTMSDTLEFQTKLSGAANPTLTFTPLGSGLNLTSAAFGANASRLDIHKVFVGLALPMSINREVGPTRDMVFSFIIASGRTSSERLAAEAVDQAIKRELLRSAIIINP